MKRKELLIFVGLLTAPAAFSQISNEGWDLNRCIEYAVENNIQVNLKELEVSASESDLEYARAQRLPDLRASASQTLSHEKIFDESNPDGTWDAINNTSASINSSLTLYKGGLLNVGVRQSGLERDLSVLNVEQARNDITLAVTQAYLNVLYSKESVGYAQEVLDASREQLIRGERLLRAGSIARNDLAQIKAQYAADQYSLTLEQNNLQSRITELKQLLEIPVQDSFQVIFPELAVDEYLLPVTPKQEAFSAALAYRPEIKANKVSESIADLDITRAKSGYLPSLTLNASYSSRYNDVYSTGFTDQFSDNQIQMAGLTLSVPIFSRKANKTNLDHAHINLDRARLNSREVEKNLLQVVERTHLDVVSGLGQYETALVQKTSADESYRLNEERFNLGMLTATELLQAKTTLLDADKALIQSKYSLILYRKILDFYQGKEITL